MSGLLASALVLLADWQANDLLWALWSSSLVVGYITIILATLVMVLEPLPKNLPASPSVKQRQQPKSWVGKLLFLLFMLVFFTIHFGGFHVGHALFLTAITEGSFQNLSVASVPLDEERDMVGWLFDQLSNSMWFIVCTGIATIPNIINHIRSDIPRQDLLKLPYVNVIKMHIMIFILVPVMLLGSPTIALLAVVIVFFMPLDLFWERFRRKRQAEIAVSD